MTCWLRPRIQHAGLLLLFGTLGCGNSVPPAILPDKPDPAAASKAMQMLDANHDGVLDEKELEKAPGLKAALNEVDTNGDKKISADEITARINYWAETKMGRTHVTCLVTRGGKPLVGAKVSYVPEPFLGGSLQTGTGITGDNGYAEINSPYAGESAIGGLSPGFYRVEITKDGADIPAQYNKETIFGAEIAEGSPSINNGMKFEIK